MYFGLKSCDSLVCLVVQVRCSELSELQVNLATHGLRHGLTHDHVPLFSYSAGYMSRHMGWAMTV